MYATGHVFSLRTLRCDTTQQHKHTQQWREEREARFLAGKTVVILSSCQLKMRILRFTVNSVLVTKLQIHNVRFEETFGVAAQFSVRSTRRCSAERCSKATTPAGGLHHPNNTRWPSVRNR